MSQILNDKEIKEFKKNGAIHLKGKFDIKWIEKLKAGINKAKINSIKGKDLTPFLIKEINKLSKNKTLDANIELIINNAALAGKLAYNFYNN